MSEDKKALIADKEISTSTRTKKKKYIFALSLLTILLVIIAGALIFYDYQGSQNGVHLNDHQKKSVTNPPGNEQKSTTDNLKKFEHIMSPSTGYTGYSILLACNSGQENLKSHFWSKDGIKIDTSNKEKYELHDGDLEINNLTENDAGVYSFLLIYDGNVKKVSYNLIIQDAYKWVEFFDLSKVEDPAYEKFYFNNEFNFGQLDTSESLVPGLLEQDFFTTIHMLSEELEKSDFHTVLMINKNVEYDWVEDSNGHVPSNALEAGEFNGEKFYIGSTLDSQQLGVIHPEAKVMHLFNDDDLMENNYKVLVLKI